MNETKNVSKRTRNPIFFRMGGGWKSVSTDSIMYMEASACKCRFFMDDGTVKEVDYQSIPYVLRYFRDALTIYHFLHKSNMAKI